MEIAIIDGKVRLDISGSFTAEELRQLLQQIGNARSQIANDPISPAGMAIESVVDPAWWTQPVRDKHASLLAFRHPALGWTAFLVPALELTNLHGYLTRQIAELGLATATAAATDSTGGNTVH